MWGIGVAGCRDQRGFAPATLTRQVLQARDRVFGDDIGGKALVGVENAAVEPVECVGAAGAGLVALGSVHEAVEQDARVVAKQFGELHLLGPLVRAYPLRSEEHTSELQSLMRISYAVFFLKKNIKTTTYTI